MLLELVTQPHCCKYFGNKICLNYMKQLSVPIFLFTAEVINCDFARFKRPPAS